ncbi:hypothetical protein BD324DRAFT_613391 [Kockovaella imperatae]|uniref:Uncharacterized protein n=1 Tax=Kockovaella imperatae TaxID=4999 RepID=A0A1Y1UUB4_9TREE|nr:hypothetical protein BD324DRAFT_613391 [Kockovaella imperatae]ORX41144.1 hypothetical protein BD324DRAFT_613391 [Kockovaella imperatae]
MPKHLPTFKHLLASPATPQKTQDRPRTKSVNDLLASSRTNLRASNRRNDEDNGDSSASRLALNPHLQPGETIWAPPSVIVGGVANLDIQEGVVHPAEIARRQEAERRRARRGVAGPAPPPSWGTPRQPRPDAQRVAGGLSETAGSSQHLEPRHVTTRDLERSFSLFSDHGSTARAGLPSLVDHCLQLILLNLNDEAPLYTGETSPESGEDQWTIGGLLSEQLPYLDTHLRTQLLACHALLPEGSASRLTDDNLVRTLADASREGYGSGDLPGPIKEEENLSADGRSIQEMQGDHPDDDFTAQERGSDKGDTPSGSSSDWDRATTSFTVHHLPITLHPSPVSLLRRINTLDSVSITSINLAYSTIKDMERLVAVLPVGLRELGLCGIRIGTGVTQRVRDGEAWRRGLSALARRLLVLRMLDISEAPFPCIQHYLTALLFPPSTRLPSLRIMSLRRSLGDTQLIASGSHDAADDINSKRQVRSDLLDIVRARCRERYVEVIWA